MFLGIWLVHKSLVYGVGKRKRVMVIISREEGGNFGSSHRRIEIKGRGKRLM